MRPRIGLALLVAGLSMGAVPPAPAGAAEVRLAVFDAYAASHSMYMQPRANSIFGLPFDQYMGATHAEMNSQPRAQGYAATYGVPLAQNARGVGIPIDYYGQCYANYPGEPTADCGVPFAPNPGPRSPEGSPIGGGGFLAHAEASGDSLEPETTKASGVTEGGGMSIADVLRIGYSRSISSSFIEDGVLHAVTASVAQDITVAGVLHIGSVEAMAEALHDGDLAAAKAMAHTVMKNVTIAGVPVVIGADGITVQGTPLGQVPTPMAAPILAAMAAQGMTIEPVPASRVVRDDGTGIIEASTGGFRIRLLSPGGDKLEMIFGQAVARAAAGRPDREAPSA
ncbi:MAG: hypothetical protein ACRD0C_18510 [Acidimicrobiia bacterium]